MHRLVRHALGQIPAVEVRHGQPPILAADAAANASIRSPSTTTTPGRNCSKRANRDPLARALNVVPAPHAPDRLHRDRVDDVELLLDLVVRPRGCTRCDQPR